MNSGRMSQAEIIEVIQNEEDVCNKEQLWKTAKTIYILGFNCIFGCRMKGVKETKEKIEACMQCYKEKVPNVTFEEKVRKEFGCDNVNFFSSREEASSSLLLQ